MSRPRAPMALRMPISRVRSRTDTSMMFMIPMPPTTSEIEAIPPSSSVSVPLIDDAAVEQLGLVEDGEVGVIGRGELVALAQQRGDLGVRGRHVGASVRR